MSMGVFDTEKLHRVQEKKKKLKKPTIMIVDDEDAHLKSLESLLSDEYDVITKQNGQNALDKIKKMKDREKIKLVISDQRMSDITGTQLFKHLIPIIPDAKRIILTAYGATDVIRDSIKKNQIYEFILKPFDPDDLKLRLKRAVESFDSQLEIEPKYQKLKKEYQEVKRKNKELRDQLSKSQTIPLQESSEKSAMKVPEKKKNWQESMKIKTKLMEIITTVKDFPEKIRSHHISPDTHIRVIIDNHDTNTKDTTEDSILVPIMKPEEQRRLLNLIPGEYQPGASEELIKIIEESRTNTDSLNLD